MTKKWLSETDRIQRDFAISIQPIFDFIPIDGQIAEISDNEVVKTFQKVKLLPSQSLIEQRDPHVLVIKVEWRLVLNHPTFSVEYKQYIRK